MKQSRKSLLFASIVLATLGAPAPARADVVVLAVAADTFINSGNPNNNAGGHAWFDAGTDGQGGVRRGLLRFDVSSSIPPGSTINSATLQLIVIRVPGVDPVDSTFNLFRLQAGWGEGDKTDKSGLPATAGEANWNARILDTANWTAPGARSDAAATASASALVGAAPDQLVSWSGAGMVNDVQFWLSNPGQNFGWLLASQAEGSPRSVRGFGSRESGFTGGALTVDYTLPVGPQPYRIDWFTLDGGGGASSNSTLAVRGTIGQPDAGKLSDSRFTIKGGFWGTITAVQMPGAPLLSITRTPTNTVKIAWPSPSSGFTLQQNTDLNTSNWMLSGEMLTDDGTNKCIIVNPPVGNRFYRLFKP